MIKADISLLCITVPTLSMDPVSLQRPSPLQGSMLISSSGRKIRCNICPTPHFWQLLHQKLLLFDMPGPILHDDVNKYNAGPRALYCTWGRWGAAWSGGAHRTKVNITHCSSTLRLNEHLTLAVPGLGVNHCQESVYLFSFFLFCFLCVFFCFFF